MMFYIMLDISVIFLNYTEFYTNLAKAYGKETIKYLFNTITFSKDINSQAYFFK